MKTDFICVYESSYRHGFYAAIASLNDYWDVENFHLKIIVDTTNLNSLVAAVRYLKKCGIDFNPVIVIMPSRIKRELSSIVFNAHFNASICYRLFYSEISNVKKRITIYFDIDVVWNKNPIDFIREMDLTKMIMAVEQDNPHLEKEINELYGRKYFNSGIVVFNYLGRYEDNIKKISGVRKILADIAPNSLYVDQDCLNIIYKNDWCSADKKWNFMTTYRKYNNEEIGIYHASGSEKPWLFPNKHPFGKVYGEIYKTIGLNGMRKYDWITSIKRIFRKIKSLQ